MVPALDAAGVRAEPRTWDDVSVSWHEYALVVVRSTWDYSDRRDAFVGWCASLGHVLNAAHVIEWNTDKRYLRELEAAGVPCVQTAWVHPGDAVSPAALPDGEVVVKPAISAGSRDTERHADARSAAALHHITRLLDAGRTVMVQPYVSTVDAHGETALVYFDGAYSHAIRKDAILTGPGVATDRLFALERIAPAEPTPSERALAEDVLDVLQWPRGELLYARVDVVRGSNGRPQLLELELTEPSLFLGESRGAAARFAAAIARRVEPDGSSRMDA